MNYSSPVYSQAASDPFPEVLQAEVTTRCNLECSFCKARPPEVRRRGDLSFELYDRVVTRLAGTLSRVNLWGAGEPMMHPDFFHMASRAASLGIRRVKVSTNGHFLSPDNIRRTLDSGITQIRIALDQSSPEEYVKGRRGGDFSRVVAGIERLCSEKRKAGHPLRVVICAVATGRSADADHPVKKLATELGADSFELQYDIWDEQGVHTRVAPSMRCAYPNKYVVLLADGQVAPCCHVWHPDWVLGDARVSDAIAIWEGARAQAFRKAYAEGSFRFCAICNYTGPLELRKIEKDTHEL